MTVLSRVYKRPNWLGSRGKYLLIFARAKYSCRKTGRYLAYATLAQSSGAQTNQCLVIIRASSSALYEEANRNRSICSSENVRRGHRMRSLCSRPGSKRVKAEVSSLGRMIAVSTQLTSHQYPHFAHTVRVWSVIKPTKYLVPGTFSQVPATNAFLPSSPKPRELTELICFCCLTLVCVSDAIPTANNDPVYKYQLRDG